MTLTELWFGLMGGPLKQIIKLLREIRSAQSTIAAATETHLDQIDSQLFDIKLELDQIKEAVIGSEAVKLIVSVGVPTEQ